MGCFIKLCKNKRNLNLNSNNSFYTLVDDKTLTLDIYLSKMKKEHEKNNFLKNIKSKYILREILTHIKKCTALQIIKYNKNLQNKLEMNKNDYKEYSELYSDIEVEIIPIKDIKNLKNDKLINIKKQEESYYHIYINQNKEEFKNYYLNKNENIKKIKIIID